MKDRLEIANQYIRRATMLLVFNVLAIIVQLILILSR